MKKMSASKSFFLLLTVAFIVMFFSAFFLTRYSAVNQVDMAQKTTPEPAEPQGMVPVIRSTPTAVPTPTSTVTPTPTPTPTPASVTSLMIPAEGKITKTHSTEKLSYSKTTGDWSIHCGIDISGPQTEVKAAAMGVVTEVREDNLLGACVIIDHPGGLQTRYYGMEETYVTLQTNVVAGDFIGITGTAAPSETAEGTHLHFEVWKNNKSLNPEDFFA